MGSFKKIGEVIDDVDHFLLARDWDGLDAYVRDFDHSDIHRSLAALRCSFGFRSKLPSWEGSLAVARGYADRDTEYRGLY